MRTDTTTLTVDEALAVAYGPNPVLETLGPNIPVDDLPARLSHCPLSAIPWQSVPTPQRYDFVKLLRSHFVPTPTALEIAQSIQRTLRMGYVERNPLNRQHRRKLHKITGLRGLGVAEAPWFPTYASGTVIKGITGLGKSTIVQRIFSLYPQVKEHGENEEAGWLQLKQIVHLTVSMSADPSRRGFLFNILAAIDEAVGDTTYHEEYFNSRISVEELMVVVGIILANHRCGFLIIEEIQKRNFFPGVSRALVLLFFLRLLNMGIPILLIGNPEGFLGFSEFTQDVRRLYSGGYFEMWPADSVDDEEWFDHYIDGKLDFNLLDTPFILTPEMRPEIIRCAGGVHGYFDSLYEIMLDNAIRRKQSHFDAAEIGQAYDSHHMNPFRPVIDALASRNPFKLLACEDISALDFAVHWGVDPKDFLAQVTASDLDKAASRHASRRTKPSRQAKPRPNFAEMEQKYKRKAARKSGTTKPDGKPSGPQEPPTDEIASALKEESDALKGMVTHRKQI